MVSKLTRLVILKRLLSKATTVIEANILFRAVYS